MSVKDLNVQKLANFAKECLRLQVGTTAISQTAKVPDSMTLPYACEIVAVEVNALTVTATITVDVLIGATSALASVITPVAATPTAGSLSTTLANKRGAAGEVLKAAYTSNGSGAATNAVVSIWIRPIPQNGEIYSV
jgi:hypothetical protein